MGAGLSFAERRSSSYEGWSRGFFRARLEAIQRTGPLSEVSTPKFQPAGHSRAYHRFDRIHPAARLLPGSPLSETHPQNSKSGGNKRMGEATLIASTAK